MPDIQVPQNGLPIPNAEWWQPHSHIILKSRYTSDDDRIISNLSQSRPGDFAMLKVGRMVIEGVVAGYYPDGTSYEFDVVKEAKFLPSQDVLYICQQIDEVSRPMTALERADFLARAKERSTAS